MKGERREKLTARHLLLTPTPRRFLIVTLQSVGRAVIMRIYEWFRSCLLGLSAVQMDRRAMQLQHVFMDCEALLTYEDRQMFYDCDTCT